MAKKTFRVGGAVKKSTDSGKAGYFWVSYDDTFTGRREREKVFAFSEEEARKKREGYTGVSGIRVEGRASMDRSAMIDAIIAAKKVPAADVDYWRRSYQYWDDPTLLEHYEKTVRPSPEAHQDLLGKTGALADMHELLAARGFHYDSEEGTPDAVEIVGFDRTATKMHQVGYTQVYRDHEGNLVRLVLVQQGGRGQHVNEPISENMTRIYRHGGPDTYEVQQVVSMT